MKLQLNHVKPYIGKDSTLNAIIQNEIICGDNDIIESGIIEIVGFSYQTSFQEECVFFKGKQIGIASQEHDGFCELKYIKPILRPLSDLTKEIEVNGEKFVPIERMKRYMLVDFKYIDNSGVQSVHFPKGNICITSINYEIADECPLGFYTKLLEWHFDVFGLIESGLAINKNTL